MPEYFKLAGTVNRHTDWTTEVVVAVNEETGEPTKVVSAGASVELSADERKKLEAAGYRLEQGSKSEASGNVGVTAPTDTSAAAPVFGVSDSDMLPASDRDDTPQSSPPDVGGSSTAASANKSNDDKK